MHRDMYRGRILLALRCSVHRVLNVIWSLDRRGHLCQPAAKLRRKVRARVEDVAGLKRLDEIGRRQRETLIDSAQSLTGRRHSRCIEIEIALTPNLPDETGNLLESAVR